MKRTTTAVCAAACTMLCVPATSMAQDANVPQFQPVEMFACSYRDGKSKKDFDRALRMMTEVESSDEPYAGFRLFPNMVTAEQDFDFIYFGAYRDGKGYGRDTAAYVEMATDAIAAWDQAADCGSSLWASYRVAAPPEGEDDGKFLLVFNNCTVADGRSNSQALEALQRWAQYRADKGMPLGTWAWFPVYGGPADDFTFKLITGFGGPQMVGDNFSWMVDNQAYLVREEMMQGLLSCDVGRLYNGERIVNTFPGN